MFSSKKHEQIAEAPISPIPAFARQAPSVAVCVDIHKDVLALPSGLLCLIHIYAEERHLCQEKLMKVNAARRSLAQEYGLQEALSEEAQSFKNDSASSSSTNRMIARRNGRAP